MLKNNKKYKVFSCLMAFALVFCMIFSSGISVSAASSDISSSGSKGTSKVATTIAPAVFNVTIPYVLPISIDKDQNVYVSDSAEITNNSNGPIRVSDAKLTTNGGWELVSSGTDFKSTPVNSKLFSMSVLNTPVPTSGNIDVQTFDSINGNSALQIDYDADAAVQGESISGQNIANVLFTIEWDNVEITKATVSKTALQSFAKTVTTFQKTPDRLNIDDVKAADGVTKIDDGATDKSIYAWSDSNGNGYWWTDAMIAHLPDDCSQLFGLNKYTLNYTNLVSLDLSQFSTVNVTDMSYMFYGCANIVSLDVSSFNTINVTTMNNMFGSMSNLKSLDLSSFDTRNVNDVQGMFYSSGLTSLDISSFDMHSVTKTKEMFYKCSNLKSLKLPSTELSNVTDTSDMFGSCLKLESLDFSAFYISNVTNMNGMFANCQSLYSLDLSSFDTSNVTDTYGMFYSCYALRSLDLSSFDTLNVTNMGRMFWHCPMLTSLDLSSFDMSNVTDTQEMFYWCSKLETIYVSNFDTSKVTSSSNMFADSPKLVGQNGTTYNSSYTDKTYARIDTAETPGYFTYKAA